MNLFRTMHAAFVIGFFGLAFPALAAEPRRPSRAEQLINSTPPFFAQVAVDRPDRTYQEGQAIRFAFRAERDAHLYLLCHLQDGRTVLLFPNAARPANQVRAGQTVQLPGPGEPFRFRVKAPFGEEEVQVLAAPQPLAELDNLRGDGRAPVVPHEVLDQLAAAVKKDPSLWADHRVALRTVAAAERLPERPAARVGLFIGIGKYGDEERSGCVAHPELRRSAERMHGLMVERGQLDPARTKLVLDDQATRANLEQFFVRWLPSVTQPGDTVFVYFSGHAGRVANLDGTELDGEDELLCPYDQDGANLGGDAGQARIRATAILDDTLARWLEELAGRQVVLILDTCHSGGVVQEELFRNEAARVTDIAQLNLVVLTGCASDEQSLIEGSPSGTMWFTHFLTERIATGGQPLTVRAAHEHCHREFHRLLRKRREVQQPTLTDTALLPVYLVPPK